MNFKWARDIPSFQQLSSHNQKILLQHSWSQLLVLSLAQLPGILFKSYSYFICSNLRLESQISFKNIQFLGLLDRQRLLSISSGSVPLAQVELLTDTVDTVAGLGLDGTEFTCLKALVLFNPHVPGLGQGEQLQIEVLQDQTGLMLQEYCNSK